MKATPKAAAPITEHVAKVSFLSKNFAEEFTVLNVLLQIMLKVKYQDILVLLDIQKMVLLVIKYMMQVMLQLLDVLLDIH